ncbi:hypothetical protein C7444_102220 [Sphaerotilus hippei]|uniref:Urease accessory protein UreH-like transmembrane domain-containing protein n=1 Tax=Sphaerotilus hippei TaxID=744406 RepID=A0A318H9K1_9BURK|nr:sulfite exporter TauE/SafE family protein [Sphaerotilus hippei]PXW98738.1 hypothetical protein C7444_102220 [Sphaerotilus hippei]
MTGALLLSALLMGLAGLPHCAGMCGSGCAAAGRACGARSTARGVAAVLAGRVIAYVLAGALAASVVGAVRWLSLGTDWLRPLWNLLQFFTLGLGLWLLLRGRLPASIEAWAERMLGRPPVRPAPGGWARIRMPAEARGVGLGMLWPLLPCGLLHAALLLAALASSPLEGALVMLVFALTSTAGLLLGPLIWTRWVPRALGRGPADDGGALGLRLSGVMLAITAGWTLLHGMGLTEQAAWCL